MADAGQWSEASRRLGGASGSRSAVHLVAEFSRDLKPDAPPLLFEPIPQEERVRGGRRFRLTAVGVQVEPLARDLVEAAQRLRHVLQQSSGPLRVACFPAHVRMVMAKLHPEEIALEIVEADDASRLGGGTSLFSKLVRHEVDLVIAPVRADRRLNHLPLYRWKLKVIVHKNHALGSGTRTITPQTLRVTPLLLSPPHHTSRDIVDRLFKRAGLTPNVALESVSTEALLAYVDENNGIAILPADAVWKASSRIERDFAKEESVEHALHWRRGEHVSDPRIAQLLERLHTLGYRRPIQPAQEQGRTRSRRT